ncbi:MAG: thioredoxin [Flavobacteriaceae bacterium]
MKNLTLLLLISLLSCNTGVKKETEQPLPVETKIADDGETFYEGKINRQNLISSPLTSWFETGYNQYYIDTQWVKEHQGLLDGLQFKLFLGTWCEDSEREVPGMLKLLDALGLDQNSMEIYAMDKNKITAANFEKGLNIINIPTLIVYKDGEEMNRIVELTIESLEKDLSKILKGLPYQNAYFE